MSDIKDSTRETKSFVRVFNLISFIKYLNIHSLGVLGSPRRDALKPLAQAKQTQCCSGN